jgi:ABC-type transport system involved in cytochrome bd biosynthesis fused ATPase/permease subunit
MFHFFLYLWNLYNKNERVNFISHISLCIFSSILLSILDWQYLFIIWGILSFSFDFNYIVIYIAIAQVIILAVSLWYYYIKYQLTVSSNKLYTQASNRHYQYIITRIDKSKSFQWISESSKVELAKKIESTERGLKKNINFLSQFSVSITALIFTLLIMTYNYPITLFFMVPLIGLVYISLYSHLTNSENKKFREEYRDVNRQTSLIISDIISIIEDAVFNKEVSNLVNNVIYFNTNLKNKQTKLYTREDKIYTQLGLILIIGVVLMVLFMSYYYSYSFNSIHYIAFFISALLTFKSLNNNITSICDSLNEARQVELDFESFNDVWENTKNIHNNNKSSINLDVKHIQYNEIDKFIDFKFDKYESKKINIFKYFINKYKLQGELLNYYNTLTIDKSLKTWKIDTLLNFINQDSHKQKQFVGIEKEYYETREMPQKLHHIYREFNNNLTKNNKLFELIISYLYFSQDDKQNNKKINLLFNQDKPLIISNNTHLLIEGESGTGKSTLLKIIRGIYSLKFTNTHDLHSNSINLTLIKHDTNTKYKLNFKQLGDNIAYFKQNNLSVIQGKLINLITGEFTKKNSDDFNPEEIKLVKKSIEIAYVHTNDLNMMIHKDKISGGQLQRIMIAKHIYRIIKQNKPIILLDEIDAGLDDETAMNLLTNLRVLFRNRVLICIVHNENLKEIFENKIFIKNGVITY